MHTKTCIRCQSEFIPRKRGDQKYCSVRCRQRARAIREGQKPRQSLDVRFWVNVNKDGPTQPHMDTPCWVWTGGLSYGYGRMIYRRERILAHRLSWQIHNGPIPDDMCCLHKCDLPACVSPSHLFLGTRADNNADKMAKGRDRSAKGEAHSSVKLTEEDVRIIRDTYRVCRVSMASIARVYGVSHTAISSIVYRKKWSHVP